MILDDFPTNLIEFHEQFNSEAACLLYVRKQRWGSADGFECPKCQGIKAWEGKTREILFCAGCGHQVSITAGTVYHGTRKSLRLWFMAMYLMMSSKQGISAKELKRQLGLKSYQTAWAWLHKLRRNMVIPDRQPLKGDIEVDETYCGGLADGTACGRSVLKKTIVACAVEKDGKACGRVRLAVVSSASFKNLKPFIESNVLAGSTLHTDAWSGYSGIEKCGYTRVKETIKESKDKAHVLFPRVHRVFSLMKRWILSTHQGAVQRKHLQAYLDEFTFRFNRRNATSISHSFQRLMEGAVRQQCDPYWQIVGRSSGNVKMRQNLELQDIIGEIDVPAVA